MKGGCCDAPAPQWLDSYGAGVRPRRHGFECPLDTFQIIAWATILILCTAYYMLHLPLLDTEAQTGLTVAVSVMAALTIGLKVTSSLAANEDHAVFGEAAGPRLDVQALSAVQQPHGKEACYYCRRFVTLGSKHCSVCDKCVLGFDHHCRWLNACVGSRNYHLFFSFVASATLAIGLVTGVGIYVIVDALRDKAKYEARLAQSYKHTSYNAYVFFLFLFAAYGLIAVAALGNLLGFHVYLFFTGQSTYQWILAGRERKMRGRAAGPRQPSAAAGGGCCAETKRRTFNKKKPEGSTSAAAGGDEMLHATAMHEPAAFTAVAVEGEANPPDGSPQPFERFTDPSLK